MQEPFVCYNLLVLNMEIRINVSKVTGCEYHTLIIGADDNINIRELKEILVEKIGVPSDKQRVIFKGQILSDDVSVTKLGLNHLGNFLVVTDDGPCPTDNSFDICVELISSRKALISVHPDETIWNLKNKIYSVEEIEPTIRRLIFAGKLLQNEQTIASVRLHHWATVHSMINLRGD
jgi:Ubiquitin family.